MANNNFDVSPAQIQERLKGVDYPASKQDLIKHAKQGGNGNDDVIKALNQIQDKKYNSPIDLNKEIGKIE